MAKQATTIKKPKAQAQTVDTYEAKHYETTPAKLNVLAKGYKYFKSVNVLIAFELEKRNKALKMINKRAINGEGQSFTAVVNDGLDLLLFCRGRIKEEDVSPEVLTIIKSIFKPTKTKSKKQTDE